MALRVILQWTNAKKAQKITNYAIITIVILNIADFIFICIVTPAFIDSSNQTWFITYDAVYNGIVLMIVYAVVLYLLMQPLKSFQAMGNDFSA